MKHRSCSGLLAVVRPSGFIILCLIDYSLTINEYRVEVWADTKVSIYSNYSSIYSNCSRPFPLLGAIIHTEKDTE